MPKLLYYIGNVELLNSTCFSIVGTRHITEYGKLECKYFTRELTNLGITIVSGMAIGTDSIAHEECINNGGNTIAVLGCGWNKIYDRSKRILELIINSGGLIISEYMPDIEAKPKNFPHRNRIICGLSEGVLAIEATEKSGTGTSMRWAKKLSVPRFACPGRLDSKYGHGVNKFIKEGAIITTDITLTTFLICTAVSLVLGIGTALVYSFKNRCTQSFAVTLAMLPAIVQIVIMLVNGNIGAGVAVAGLRRRKRA